jgi:hypothetical protein
VRGAFDKDSLRRIVRIHLNELHYCRDSQPGHSRTLPGQLDVRFAINRSGEVTDLSIVGATAGMASIKFCVAQAIRRWAFPKSAGGNDVTVTLPLTFSAERRATDPELPFLNKLLLKPAAPGESEWDLGLAILRKKGSLKERLAQVSAVVGGPQTESPTVLGWWIAQHRPAEVELAPSACVLAARLLREAGLEPDAIRVLSEAGADAPKVIGDEYRRWDRASEVSRLRDLTARK